MAYTYAWSDAIAVARKLYSDIPITALDPYICDMVSAKMWNAAPWRERIQNIPSPGTLLVDGTQDYNAPVAIHLLLRARITRTDTTPDVSYPLDVTEHLEPDLQGRSHTAMRLISHEPDLGVLRLDSAVTVPSGVTLRLNGEYEIQHTKITATSQGMWFKDQYLEVGVKGLAYWGYKLGKDARAGEIQSDGKGRQAFTGMLGEWMAAIAEMRDQEDFAALPQLFPDDSLGSSSDTGGFIYP